MDNKIEIPQNDNLYFIINKSKEWNYCIDVKINCKEEINLINLYLIIKSYIKNIEFFCFKISILILKKEEKDIIVCESLYINEISNQNFWDFQIWFNERITRDLKYITDKEDIYSFRFSFQKKIIEGLNKKYNKDVLSELRPIYPWNEKILEDLKIKTEEIENLKKKNKILEDKIKILEDKIRNLTTK